MYTTCKYHNLLTVILLAALYYDYLLTLDDEVAFYWGRRRGFISYLFYFNRYVSLVGVLFFPVHNLFSLTNKVSLFVFLFRPKSDV